jgi:hypothetical protein
VLWRPAAALLTGPLAFLLAGVIDVGALVLAVARDRVQRRVRARLGRATAGVGRSSAGVGRASAGVEGSRRASLSRPS